MKHIRICVVFEVKMKLNAWGKTKKYTSNIRLPKECMGCDKKNVCSVCAAMCQSETGAFYKRPDYVCHDRRCGTDLEDFTRL